MANARHAVLWDPANHFWQGALTTLEQAKVVEQRGGSTIPVHPELFGKNGAAGVAVKRWGAGWPLGRHPSRISPVLLLLVPGLQRLSWRARLRKRHDAPKDWAPNGQVRFAVDNEQQHVSQFGFGSVVQPIELAKLGAADDKGGWSVGGEVRVDPATDMYVGFMLWGYGEGTMVEMFAASQVGVDP